MVPVKGGKWHIIPQLAVHTTYIYILLIYCLLGGYMLPTTFYGNQKQPLNKAKVPSLWKKIWKDHWNHHLDANEEPLLGRSIVHKTPVVHRNYFPAVERHIPCTETVAWEEVLSEMSCNWNSGCKRNQERSSTMHHLEFLCKFGKKKTRVRFEHKTGNTWSCHHVPIQVGSKETHHQHEFLLKDMDSDRTSATSSCFQKRLVLAGFSSIPLLLRSPWRLLQPWQCFTV